MAVKTFEVVPSFNACSYYLPSPNPDALSVTYRKTGGEWREALPPPYFVEDDMFRGSIVDLQENTSYEIRIAEENGEMVLSGPIVDQAALYGVLTKLRNLGLPLLSVSRCDLDLGAMFPCALDGRRKGKISQR